MTLCDDRELAGIVAAMQRSDGGEELSGLDELLARYPEDPRLHFMRGSILAGRQQAQEAHAALKRAVDLAPEFHIARYQLGFFELTSGEVDQALSTWGPLVRLEDDAYLRCFVEGLTFLIRDEFAEAAARLNQGIERNRENQPLNDDIRKILNEIGKLEGKDIDGLSDGEEAQESSATSLILGQFASEASRH